MNTIHLALISMLVERDDVDATNAVQLLTTAETNMLNAMLPAWKSIAPERRRYMLNQPMNPDMIDQLIIWTSQNGARDIFKA